LCKEIRRSFVKRFKIIAFTHKTTEVNNLSRFFISEEHLQEKLSSIKAAASIDELFYISTCNRIEFLFCTESSLDHDFLSSFYTALNSSWTAEDIRWNISHSLMFEGEEALEHILNVASSLDSLVVGEREIIAQVRKSYDLCQKLGFTGDMLRLVDKVTVKTAKEVFTHTKIAQKSVSVVFLAYQMLRELNVRLDARFLIIGSGQTNATMAKYLLKHGFRNFTVFNRTLQNAEKLAAELNGKAYALDQLHEYTEGFDVILSCTASAEAILNEQLYAKLLGDDTSRKILIDLAIPNDIDPAILSSFNTHLIGISNLKAIAQTNLLEREKELVIARQIVADNIEEFRHTFKHRQVELAMQEVPRKIKEIRHSAINSVFAKEVEQLDDQARQVLDKVLSYMEKKCISVPMVIAKEIFIEK
jgi:glutamyl-tRNA reductase